MGNLLTTASDPFVTFTVPVQWSWLTENPPWSLVHMTLPLIFYCYFRQVRLVLLLAYLFETAEALVGAILYDSSSGYFTENRFDALISDMSMALLGILIAELIIRATRWNRALLHFEVLWSRKHLLFKYIFQLVCFAAVSVTGTWNLPPNGYVSLGTITMTACFPLFFAVFGYWNLKEYSFKETRFYDDHVSGEIVSQLKAIKNSKDYDVYYAFVGSVTVFLLFVWGLFFIRYLPSPIMTYIYSVATILFVAFYLFVDRQTDPIPSSRGLFDTESRPLKRKVVHNTPGKHRRY